MLKQPQSSGEYRNNVPEVLVDTELKKGNPFPGLRPFSIDECHLFFGREGQADEILVKLAQNRFITVMGYSGSGKSSLMYCGLVPILYGGFMTQTSHYWNAIITRPGSSPLNNLAETIVEHLLTSKHIQPGDRAIQKSIISSVLRSGPNGLIEVFRFLQTKKAENIFLLIDQFEELFRFRENTAIEDAQNEAHLYVNLFLTAVAQTKVPAYVALTMRSDFIGNCSVFPALTELINRSNYLVPQMTREQKKMAIEGPVAVGGGKISQRLIKRLLTDVGNDQDQLPILQHVLMRTWDYWLANREPGEPIDLRHYNAVGRIHEALSQHANEAYDELSSKQKEVAEILFKNCTEKTQDNKGMRRPVRLGLVADLAEAEEKDVVHVVDHFRKPGRSFLMPAANVLLNNNSMIELSHESLMRIWKRLNVWVDEEFESAQMYKRLSEASAMYQIGKTGLWRPPDLQLALNWQKKQRPTREWSQRYDDTFERAIVFLDTSRITYEAELKNQEMMQRRVLRRTRATAVILGMAFVVVIALFVFSYIQKIDADSQRFKAETRRIEAVMQTELATKSQTEALEQTKIANDKSVQLAGANDALQTALKDARREKLRAEAALSLAKNEQNKAILAGNNEKGERLEAQRQTEIAKNEFDKANSLYILAIAQSLATKSVRENDDESLAGLLAMQGYYFHYRNGGKPYDPYIYEGLYTALTKLNTLSYNAIKAQGSPHVHIKSLTVSSRNNIFYTSGADGRILKGDYKKQISLSAGFNTLYPGKTIALSKDENYLVNGSDSTCIQIYDLRGNSKKSMYVVWGLEGAPNDLAFLKDGSGVVVSTNKTLSIIDHVNGVIRKQISVPYEIKNFDLSPDGKTLVGATWTGQVVSINLESFASAILTDDSTLRILSVRFSPEGDKLAYGVEEKTSNLGNVKMYDLKTQKLEQFPDHQGRVNDIEFSPNGKLLATAGADGELLLWVLDSPSALPITMNNNNGFIWDIAFTSESQYLIATCSESEIRIWPIDPALLAGQICSKLKRSMTLDEWKKYVGEDDNIAYEPTCVGY
jgi:WD40 repeat protein